MQGRRPNERSIKPYWPSNNSSNHFINESHAFSSSKIGVSNHRLYSVLHSVPAVDVANRLSLVIPIWYTSIFSIVTIVTIASDF